MFKFQTPEIPELFYNEIKNSILKKESNDTFFYTINHYQLSDENTKLNEQFYEEQGSVIFRNKYGQTVKLEIKRYHKTCFGGPNFLYPVPTLEASISTLHEPSKKFFPIWELKSGTNILHYSAKVTTPKFPYFLISEPELEAPQLNKTNKNHSKKSI